MQLLVIFGISFAIAGVVFALQNTAPVTVSFILWEFESSLALVLLLALGLGALVAALVSAPRAMKFRWVDLRQRRKIKALEAEIDKQRQRVAALEFDLEDSQAKQAGQVAGADSPASPTLLPASGKAPGSSA